MMRRVPILQEHVWCRGLLMGLLGFALGDIDALLSCV